MTRHVGQPIERLEDLRLLRGKGRFVDDLALEGMLYAVVVRSPIAHGRITRIDVAGARALDGVVAAYVGADFATLPTIPIRLAPLEGVERYAQRPIATGKVRFVGEPVAIVVAQSPELAEDAADLVEIDIAPLPAVTDWATSSIDASLLFEEQPSNVSAFYSVGVGDSEAAFSTAFYTRREMLYCHRHTALPMETRGLVAAWDQTAGVLTLWGSTKVLWHNRRALADALGLDREKIQLLDCDVGGGFGVRGELYPEDYLIPFVARDLRRPVKWIEDRREHLMATNHSREMSCDLEIACARDGKILGLRGTIYADMGAYTRTNGGIVPARAAQYLVGPYKVPAAAFSVAMFMTNKTPVGTYRGPGRFEANFFRERLMDMAADDLGLDAAVFRQINLIQPEDLPYSTGALVPFEKPAIYDTGDYPAALRKVLDAIDYDRLRSLSGREIGGRRHGVGLACFVECSGGGPRENARFALEADGIVSIHTGGSFVGQGLQTALTQIAADALGLPMACIRVHNGSTRDLAEGFGTFASRSAIKGGSAVVVVAKMFVDAVLARASDMVGRPTNDLHWQDGAVRAHDGTVVYELADVARHTARTGKPLCVDGGFHNPDVTFSYGAHAAYVAVDPRTGHVEILDYYAVEDIGVAINPLIIHGQLIGSIVQGLGGTFLDHLVYDDQGQLLTGTLADYLVPTATDFPVVRGESYADKAALSNPLGVKGAGEGGIVGVAGAVANAVAAALRPLGAEITRLPLSPPIVWRAIADANG